MVDGGLDSSTAFLFELLPAAAADDDDSLWVIDNAVKRVQETMHEDEWYNRSLNALRMNNSHPSLANSMLQYQT